MQDWFPVFKVLECGCPERIKIAARASAYVSAVDAEESSTSPELLLQRAMVPDRGRAEMLRSVVSGSGGGSIFVSSAVCF